ncbi:DUF1236 domain-containing protein [Amorphus sp. 3PC139-8]|uniref:DUF1236 domain-containing protein n=1 Tax=Amorphus sp. 3PC139-8 TaxID=2735676 RepID=UPI00345D1130
MNKFFTITSAAALAIATAGAPAMAQDSTVTGVAGGAATGAVVGGPPGAVIGAIAGGTIGATMDKTEQAAEQNQAARPHVVKSVPNEVGTYAIQRPAPKVQVSEPVKIGEPLPRSATVRQVPDYPEYAYANVNGQAVVVDADTGEVIGVVQQ